MIFSCSLTVGLLPLLHESSRRRLGTVRRTCCKATDMRERERERERSCTPRGDVRQWGSSFAPRCCWGSLCGVLPTARGVEALCLLDRRQGAAGQRRQAGSTGALGAHAERNLPPTCSLTTPLLSIQAHPERSAEHGHART